MRTEAQQFASLTPSERAQLNQLHPERYKSARNEWLTERERLRGDLSRAKNLADRQSIRASLSDLESVKSSSGPVPGVAPDVSHSARVYAQLHSEERAHLKASDPVKHDILRKEWSSERERLEALVANANNFTNRADYQAAFSALRDLTTASLDRPH